MESGATGVEVREARSEDGDAIGAVHRAAFGQAAEADLVARLRASGRLSLSLVAAAAGRVVGHLAFSPVRAAGPAERVSGLGLAPLGVLPEHQRQGIGAALVRSGLERCAQAGVAYVVVLGDPRYYARFGFTPAREWGLGNQFTTGDAFQILELRPGAAPRHGTMLLYGPEFSPWAP